MNTLTLMIKKQDCLILKTYNNNLSKCGLATRFFCIGDGAEHWLEKEEICSASGYWRPLTAGYSSFCSLDEDPLYVHNAKCTAVIDLDALNRELDFEVAAIDLEEPFVMIILSPLIFIALLREL